MADSRLNTLLSGLTNLIDTVSQMPDDEPEATPEPAKPSHLETLRRLERFQGQSVTLTFSTDSDEGESITLTPKEGVDLYHVLASHLS